MVAGFKFISIHSWVSVDGVISKNSKRFITTGIKSFSLSTEEMYPSGSANIEIEKTLMQVGPMVKVKIKREGTGDVTTQRVVTMQQEG
ncbi:MAG: hypothetical protein ACOYXT_08905 [Bacteroidota bacterium]